MYKTTKACLHPFTCLNERSRAMRLTPPMGWDNECLSCMEGAARQLDAWKPEADTAPVAPQGRKKHSPLPLQLCVDCDTKISYGANRCRPCLDKTRTKTRDAKAEREAERCA